MPLAFLHTGAWTLRAFADQPDRSDYQASWIHARRRRWSQPAPDAHARGGFAGIISET